MLGKVGNGDFVAICVIPALYCYAPVRSVEIVVAIFTIPYSFAMLGKIGNADFAAICIIASFFYPTWRGWQWTSRHYLHHSHLHLLCLARLATQILSLFASVLPSILCMERSTIKILLLFASFLPSLAMRSKIMQMLSLFE